MLKKIVITGPESSGKSTLAESLAKTFDVPCTNEKAREYLSKLERPYNYEDLEAIAKLQIEAEDTYIPENSSLLFCDTDLLTIKIWSKYKYQKVSDQILQWINKRDYDLYLLCKPDIPWEDDPLRENPNERDLLFNWHLDELNHYHKNYEIIEGHDEARIKLAVKHIEKYLYYWFGGGAVKDKSLKFKV